MDILCLPLSMNVGFLKERQKIKDTFIQHLEFKIQNYAFLKKI